MIEVGLEMRERIVIEVVQGIEYKAAVPSLNCFEI